MDFLHTKADGAESAAQDPLPRFRLMRRYPTAAGVKTVDIRTYQFGDVLIRFAPTAEHALELVRAMGIVGGVVALPCDENGRLLERSLEMAS